MIKTEAGDLICFKVEDGGWESEVLLGVVLPYGASYFVKVRAMHGSTYIIRRGGIISNLSNPA